MAYRYLTTIQTQDASAIYSTLNEITSSTASIRNLSTNERRAFIKSMHKKAKALIALCEQSNAINAAEIRRIAITVMDLMTSISQEMARESQKLAHHSYRLANQARIISEF